MYGRKCLSKTKELREKMGADFFAEWFKSCCLASGFDYINFEMIQLHHLLSNLIATNVKAFRNKNKTFKQRYQNQIFHQIAISGLTL